MSRVPVGVLLSGRGSNLQALLDACATPGFPARVAVVISNRAQAGGLERARAAGVPTRVVSHQARTREDFEQQLVATLRDYAVRWVCLAGFMRLLTPHFLAAFPNRVLNIHPSLLPAFPGRDAQGQAFRAGVRVSGATVHLVDAGTDTGPIVLQGAVGVRATDTEDVLRERILQMEHQLYPRALRLAVEGRISVQGAVARLTLPAGDEGFLMGARTRG